MSESCEDDWKNTKMWWIEVLKKTARKSTLSHAVSTCEIFVKICQESCENCEPNQADVKKFKMNSFSIW